MNLKKLINQLLGRPTITLAQRLITQDSVRQANLLLAAGVSPRLTSPRINRPDINDAARAAMRATKDMRDAHSRAHVNRVMQQLNTARTNKPD